MNSKESEEIKEEMKRVFIEEFNKVDFKKIIKEVLGKKQTKK